MAAVHFTTIPYDPYTAHKVRGKPYCCSTCPSANDTVYARFEGLRTFLCVSYERLKGFRALQIMVKCPSRRGFFLLRIHNSRKYMLHL